MNTVSWRQLFRPRHVALIFLICLFMFLSAVWIRLNQGPTFWDDSWYLQDSLQMFDALMNRGPGAWVHYFLHEAQLRYKAPLICALPTPIYLITGRIAHHALYLNVLLMPLLLVGVYAIAGKYFSARTALLAVFIAGSMPELYGLATFFLVEYGLATFAVLAIVCLVYSRDLRQTRWVMLFSVICGLGVMQKIIFPIDIAPLTLYFIFRWIRRLSRGEAKAASMTATLAALLLPALVIAGPWYAFNLKDVLNRAELSGYDPYQASLHGTGDPYTLAAMGKYLVRVINEGIGAPYFCAAVIVLAILAFLRFGGPRQEAQTFDIPDRTENPPFWHIAVLWLLPLLVFLLGSNTKQVRFIAPILPIFALCLAIALNRLISGLRSWGYALVLAILGFALFCQIQNSFEPIKGLAFSIPSDPAPTQASPGIRFIANKIGTARVMEQQPWPLAQIMDELLAARTHPNDHMDVMLGWDSSHWNNLNLGLIALQCHQPINVQTTAYYTDADRLREDIGRCSFFLFPENAEPQAPGVNKLQDVALKEVNDPSRFQVTQSPLVFPDHSILKIYRNLQPGVDQSRSSLVAGNLPSILPCDVRFGDAIALNGLWIERVGSSIKVRYRWVCRAPIDRQYRCFTHIRDDSGKNVGWLDHDIVEGKPAMVDWKPGDVVEESLTSLPLTGASGKIYLDIGLYDPGTQDILHARVVDLTKFMGWSLMPKNIGVTFNPDP